MFGKSVFVKKGRDETPKENLLNQFTSDVVF